MLETYISILINGVLIGGLYGLSSSAFSFQVGALKTTNLSYGACLMSSMYFTYYAIRVWALPLPIAILVLFLFYYLLGIMIYRLILGKAITSRQILCTLGVQLIVLNLTSFLTTGYPRNMNVIEHRIFLTPGISFGITQLICFGMAGVILLGFNFFLKKTWTGRAIRSVVQKKEIACLMGINGAKMLQLAFGLSYIILSMAGAMLALSFQISPEFGDYMQVIAFIVTVSAGLGNLGGAYVSGILFGVISALISTIVGTKYHDTIIFTIFIIVLLVRPYGMFTRKANVAREL